MRLNTTTAAIVALAAKVALAENQNETWPDKCKVLQFSNVVSDKLLRLLLFSDVSLGLLIMDSTLNGKISGAVDECTLSPRTGVLKCKKGGNVLSLETNK
ncbi:hypothetical protein PG994_013991 [Apiospora phragmitis]|uniref:Uncharacterized protein n=1 Tax=Apiospora phragmitis TaxID=2905665 RepID=A0ABR1T525_9PEZI